MTFSRNATVAALTLTLACAVWAMLPTHARAAQSRAFVYATDFSSGSISDIQFGPPRTVAPDQSSVSSDAVLRHHDGLLYVVNRFGFDNIQVLDPANSFATVQQFSVGNGSNPHDIELVSTTKGYVARYESPDLWIVNPQTGAHTGTISLAAFADDDGIPEMDRMILWGGRLFVSLQRLDRNNFFTPTDSSQIVVIDVVTNALIDADPSAPGTQGILLPFQNPNTEIVADTNGKIVVGCTGNFGVADGGVVQIDPIALSVTSIEVSESALGGDINDVAVQTTERGFTVVSDGSFNTILKPYRRDLGTVQSPILSTSGFFLADIEVNDRAELWVCDRTPSGPGIRVFDAASGSELTAMPLDTSIPPQDIAFDGVIPVGVASAGTGSEGVEFAIIGVRPNPVLLESTVYFQVGRAALPGGSGAADLSIFDVSGRIVKRLNRELSGPGEFVLVWDGTNEQGEDAPPGVYLLHLSLGAQTSTGRVVRVR